MSRFRFSFQIFVVCLSLSLIVGCGANSAPIAPRAQNPNPDLQPAGRGVEGGSQEQATVEALGGN